ncbi:MAG: malate synthase G, partial [Novosphingobium sp.]|nr:malate synthase G [Novosphingobium sp.]
MSDRVEKSGLQVDAALAAFIENEVVSPLGQDLGQFWAGFAALVERFVPVNRALLAKRDDLQATIDAWHAARAGQPINGGEYQAFLRE